MNRRILVVDDDPEARETLALGLRSEGFQTTCAATAEEALERVRNDDLDILLSDIRMPDIDGLQLCRTARECRPDVPVIMITAFGSMETAVEALRAGAFDFVSKPVEFELVAAAVRRALKQRELEEKVRHLDREVKRFSGFGEMLGESPIMRETYSVLQRVAQIEIPVLIMGESGTGKELAARAIHRESPRRDQPFIPVNCPALPETLLESELFGHEANAYTGAGHRRKGLFQQADGGSLFLDEIGDFPLALQPKLLRVLEEQTVRPVGSDREVRVNVRIIAATNHDLRDDARRHRFRDDLYYRINGVSVRMPPLRERGADVLLLAQHFLDCAAERWERNVGKLSRSVAERLRQYPWPGNVRELRNALEHAAALTRRSELSPADLPHPLQQPLSDVGETGADGAVPLSLRDMERRHILHVLEVTGGNKSEASDILGLDRKTLYRKLRLFAGENTERDAN